MNLALNWYLKKSLSAFTLTHSDVFWEYRFLCVDDLATPRVQMVRNKSPKYSIFNALGETKEIYFWNILKLFIFCKKHAWKCWKNFFERIFGEAHTVQIVQTQVWVRHCIQDFYNDVLPKKLSVKAFPNLCQHQKKSWLKLMWNIFWYLACP